MSLINGKKGPKVSMSIPAKQPDPIPHVEPAGEGPLDKDQSGRFQKGNKFAKLAKLKTGPKVLGRMETSVPEMKEWITWARRYIKQRKVELAKLSGGEISAGVSAMVQASGMSYASSYFAYQQGVAMGDIDLLKKSSSMAVEARQQDLAAYELAIREGKARPARSPHELLKEALAVEATTKDVAPPPAPPSPPPMPHVALAEALAEADQHKR